MPSNNSKYTDEMRERTAKFITRERKICNKCCRGNGDRYQHSLQVG